MGDIRVCEGCSRLEQERENVTADQASPAVKITLVPRAVGEALMAKMDGPE